MLSTVLNATDCTKRWTICPLIASAYVTDIHIFKSITEIPVLQWKSIVPADCFFMSYDYLHNLETSETNRLEMKLRYATFVKGNKTVAAAVFQIVHINGSQNFRVRRNSCTTRTNPICYTTCQKLGS